MKTTYLFICLFTFNFCFGQDFEQTKKFADNCYLMENWNGAIETYKLALKIKPTDDYCKKRLDSSIVKQEEFKANPIYRIVEEHASFTGGMSKLYSLIGEQLKYPAEAQKNNISGKVYLTFIINIDGTISDLKVIKGIGYGCDDEALRVLKTIPPNWQPARMSGRKVRSWYNLPIQFSLN